jgi:peptidoglycan/LPS O-acetylase OafA/YrhL
LINQSVTASLIPDRPIPESGIAKLCKCFSFSYNYEKLIEDRVGEDANLGLFNGWKALLILWIIFARGYIVRMDLAINYTDIPYVQAGAAFAVGGGFAIDCFFFIAGFLIAYLFSIKLERKGTMEVGVYLEMVINRYLRIVPAYAFVLLLYWRIVQFIGNGPVWYKYVHHTKSCDKMWWGNLLLIDNYVNKYGEYYCFDHGWYIANDFQMFLLTPWVIYLNMKSPSFGRALMFLGLVASCTYTMLLSNAEAFPASFLLEARRDLESFYEKYYYAPWCRAVPWIIGMLCGIFYREVMAKDPNREDEPLERRLSGPQRIAKAVKEAFWLRWLMYIIGAAMMYYMIELISPMLQVPANSWSQFGNDFYVTFAKAFFVFGFAIFTFAMMMDENSWFRAVLSCKFATVLGRLSFCAYLLHRTVQYAVLWTTRAGLEYSHYNLTMMFLSDSILTFFFAFFVNILVEQPFGNLVELLLGGSKAAQVVDTRASQIILDDNKDK